MTSIHMIKEECLDTYSTTFAYLSMYCWFVAQIPQQVENYRNKKCEGISLAFLTLWFLGDLTSLIGCILTDQLTFQIYIAVYFLYNDLILFTQWYYYNFIYKHRHHSHSHSHNHNHINVHNRGARREVGSARNAESIPIIEGVLAGHESSTNTPVNSYSSIVQSNDNKRRSSFIQTGLLVASMMIGKLQGAPIVYSSESGSVTTLISSQLIGTIVTWVCAGLYLGARLPQLYKNYKRKSVDGISPLLFFTLIVANLCYSASIVFNCRFSYDYFINELPYILGSAGTVGFDLMYFYQRWIYDS